MAPSLSHQGSVGSEAPPLHSPPTSTPPPPIPPPAFSFLRPLEGGQDPHSPASQAALEES